MPRTMKSLGSAFADAVPDALAAAACALAWKAPDAPGFDLLATCGLLYFIELPLAVLVGFAGVRRVRDRSLSRADKLWFVLLPSLLLGMLCLDLLGIEGLVAVAWLGGLSMLRLLRDTPDTAPDVPGLWLEFGKRGAAISFQMIPHKPSANQREPGTVLVPAGHDQLMASATIATWLIIPLALAILPEFPEGGATAAYAASIGWHDTVVGRLMPAHLAVAAGLILFGVRTLGHFESVGEPPPAKVEDDEVLREVIGKVEGRKPDARRRRRR